MIDATIYHAHLDECRQCRENPFAMCAVGQAKLKEAAGAGEPESQSDTVAPTTSRTGVTGPKGACCKACKGVGKKPKSDDVCGVCGGAGFGRFAAEAGNGRRTTYSGAQIWADIQMLRRLASVGETAIAAGFDPAPFSRDLGSRAEEAWQRLQVAGSEALQILTDHGGSDAD